MKKTTRSIFVRLTVAVGAVWGAALGFFSAPGPLFAVEPTVPFSWNFDSAADATGWGRNHLTPPKIENGSLVAQFEGWDPFVVSPKFELTPRPGQLVEIRMKSTGESTGEFYFASSDDGPYNGFSPQKMVLWDIKHDGEFHTYQIMPNWLAEPKIIKFRVDVGRPTPDEIAQKKGVEIDYIKIVDLNVDQAAPLDSADWDADRLAKLETTNSTDGNVWRSEIFEGDPAKIGDVLYFEGKYDSRFDAGTPFPKAKIRFLTSDKNGVLSFDLPLPTAEATPDENSRGRSDFGQNVDLSLFNGWGDKFYRWELATPRGCSLTRLAFGKAPQGPGAFDFRLVGPKRAINRIDAKTGSAVVEYEAIVRNRGGKTIEKIGCETLQNEDAPELLRIVAQKTAVDSSFGTNPTGDRLAVARPDDSGVDPTVWTVDAKLGKEIGLPPIDSQPSRKLRFVDVEFPEALTLAPGEALRLVASFETKKPGHFVPAFACFERDSETPPMIRIETPFEVLPSLDLPPQAEYVSEPRPVESEYEIGAFYFPGWSKRSGWDKIDVAAPIRKPVLGWYDEGNPEVVDWQIKWATENGIQFFFVDWYWRNGNISLDHWIKAFQAAKYRKYLKWAVMWANHTGPGTHSEKDWRAVTQYWIDNYFKTPEYYRIDGKPVVVIWDQSLVDADMIAEAKAQGVDLKPGEGVKKALEISRQVCVDAGLPGVYFIAIKWPERATDPATVQKLADGGFDATTIYHFMDPGDAPRDPKLYPFADVVSASKPNWEARQETGILPFIPNISTGWDSRPWHGFRQTVVYDRTVDEFRKLCADYKEFADKTGVKRAVLAPLNEWGEGSYIEPNKEFGFGMYEALRETLCKKPDGGFPENFAPEEVGLGPYDLPETND